MFDYVRAPGCVLGVYAPSYQQLEDNLRPRISETLSRYGLMHRWVGGAKQNKFILRSGEIRLRSMSNPETIVGYETLTAKIDEIETMPYAKAKDAFDKINARNRQVIGKIPNRISTFTTADAGLGGFTYSIWGENELKPKKERNDQFKYVRAPTYSNLFLPPDYVDNLRKTYTKKQEEAFIEGKWVNLASGVVYTEFDRQKCDTDRTIKEVEPLYIGMDFNVGEMSAVVCVRNYNANGKSFEAVSEFKEVLDTPTMIRAIKNKYPNRRITVYPDCAGNNRSTSNASISDISLLQQAGFTVLTRKAHPAVKDRIQAVQTALMQGTLKISVAGCPKLVSCMEKQSYTDAGEPDKKSGFDHMNDALGYLVEFEMPVKKPQSYVPLKW
jgi:hypothetical protein